LIELLVVLLIIGILLAIAIPTFLGVTKSANNTAAQSNLQTALTGAKAYFTSNTQSFANIETSTRVPSIEGIDTGLSYVTAATGSSGPHVVSVKVGPTATTGSWVVLEAWSSGTQDCWGILDVTASPAAGSFVDGITSSTQVGTYFFVRTKATTANLCRAATALSAKLVPPNRQSQTGFPQG